MTVVRDDDNRVLEIHEIVFEPSNRPHVEVVGRLVQYQNVRIPEQALRKEDFDLFLRVEVRHQRIVVLFTNVQSVQKALRLALRLPTAEVGKFALEFARADSVLVRKIRFRVQRVLLAHDFHEPRVTQQHGIQYRFVVKGVLVLVENGDALVLVHDHAPARRLQRARQQAEKGRFSRAVRADNAVTVALGKFEVDVLKQFPSSELQS